MLSQVERKDAWNAERKDLMKALAKEEKRRSAAATATAAAAAAATAATTAAVTPTRGGAPGSAEKGTPEGEHFAGQLLRGLTFGLLGPTSAAKPSPPAARGGEGRGGESRGGEMDAHAEQRPPALLPAPTHGMVVTPARGARRARQLQHGEPQESDGHSEGAHRSHAMQLQDRGSGLVAGAFLRVGDGDSSSSDD